MADARTCMAPHKKGEEEPCGNTHAAEFGECPVYGRACRKHHQSQAAIQARKEQGSRGGRPRLIPDGGAEPVDPDEVGMDPSEALASLAEMAARQRKALHTLLELGDVESASRKLGIDIEVLEQWMAEDLAFRQAHTLMKAYAPSRIRDFLAVGAAMCTKRLVLAAHKTSNVELLLKISRVVMSQHDKMMDKDLAEELALLREQVEVLQDELRKQVEAG